MCRTQVPLGPSVPHLIWNHSIFPVPWLYHGSCCHILCAEHRYRKNHSFPGTVRITPSSRFHGCTMEAAATFCVQNTGTVRPLPQSSSALTSCVQNTGTVRPFSPSPHLESLHLPGRCWMPWLLSIHSPLFPLSLLPHSHNPFMCQRQMF